MCWLMKGTETQKMAIKMFDSTMTQKTYNTINAQRDVKNVQKLH